MKRSTKPIRKRAKLRRGREYDAEYLRFIRGYPCVICDSAELFQDTATEAAHVGERGLGQKCSDRETIPLCEYHHRTGPLSHHSMGRHFWFINDLNKAALIAHYNKLYQEGS